VAAAVAMMGFSWHGKTRICRLVGGQSQTPGTTFYGCI
jgi:hypothetical protein